MLVWSITQRTFSDQRYWPTIMTYYYVTNVRQNMTEMSRAFELHTRYTIIMMLTT